MRRSGNCLAERRPAPVASVRATHPRRRHHRSRKNHHGAGSLRPAPAAVPRDGRARVHRPRLDGRLRLSPTGREDRRHPRLDLRLLRPPRGPRPVVDRRRHRDLARLPQSRRHAARTAQIPATDPLRERVFGGNVETLSSWFSGDHPAWSSWTEHAGRRAEIDRRTTDPRFAPLNVIHLRSPREATAWLRGRPHPTSG